MSTDLKDLGLLLDSKVPVLVIESFEEPRVLEMITRLAVKLVSALYTVSAIEESLTPQQLIETIHGTHPLSVVMREKIQGLRLWAKERCVFAD